MKYRHVLDRVAESGAGSKMPVRRGEAGGGPARFLSLFRRLRQDSDPVRLVHTAGDGESGIQWLKYRIPSCTIAAG